MKEQLKFLLYGMAAIFGMAGLLEIPQVKTFITANPFITVVIAIGIAVATPKITGGIS